MEGLKIHVVLVVVVTQLHPNRTSFYYLQRGKIRYLGRVRGHGRRHSAQPCVVKLRPRQILPRSLKHFNGTENRRIRARSNQLVLTLHVARPLVPQHSCQISRQFRERISFGQAFA
jgi:hypothetical protein